MTELPYDATGALPIVPPTALPKPVAAAMPPSPPPPSAPAWTNAAPPSAAPWGNANVAPQAIVITRASGPSMLVRAVWYLFVGWWLTGIVISIAYVAALTLIGLPIAFWLFNRLPTALTLRARNKSYATELRNGVAYLVERNPIQLSMPMRAAYFVLVGWWAGAIWMGLAYVLCLTVIGIPLGLMMFNRVGGVMTLLRY